MVKGLEHLTDVERLRVLGLLSLEKRWSGGGLNIRKYPKGGCKQDGARLFQCPRDRVQRTQDCRVHRIMLKLQNALVKPHHFEIHIRVDLFPQFKMYACRNSA